MRKVVYQPALDTLVTAYQNGQPLVLLFDYDGTLTPLVAHPRLARLSARVRSLLQELARQPRVFVGIISGRKLEEVKRLVGLPGLFYSGTSGLELDLRGEVVIHPRAQEGYRLVAQAAQGLRTVAAGFAGAWVEHKPLGLTLHFREVATPHVRELCCRARQLFRPWADQWRLLDAPQALEITPALGWTKASAVLTIVREVSGQPCPLYAGDDSNDSDALELVAELGGVALGIGPRAPLIARCRLTDPAALQRLLTRLLAALSSDVLVRQAIPSQDSFSPRHDQPASAAPSASSRPLAGLNSHPGFSDGCALHELT